MICPVCESAMIVVEYHDVELDYCDSCRGVWFDSGELELLLESHGLKESKTFLDGILQAQEAASSEKKRKCPICGHKMKKTAIGQEPKILIDMCHDEHGLWFDGGEVSQLMKHLATEHPHIDDAGEQVIGFLEEVFEAPQQ
ncbi:MAG: zf-TFIIB domain-containing protein [Dehalococcoidia bacterium]|nr:zf-TFIIB domain-containing protein [Dehalococcoidia bacterium]